MSRRLFIVVEGQTEEEFIKELLCPYLSGFGIFDVRPVRKSRDGVVSRIMVKEPRR